MPTKFDFKVLRERLTSAASVYTTIGEAITSLLAWADEIGARLDKMERKTNAIDRSFGQLLRSYTDQLDALHRRIKALENEHDMLGAPGDPVTHATSTVVDPRSLDARTRYEVKRLKAAGWTIERCQEITDVQYRLTSPRGTIMHSPCINIASPPDYGEDWAIRFAEEQALDVDAKAAEEARKWVTL